jgi:putative flippase GtrA
MPLGARRGAELVRRLASGSFLRFFAASLLGLVFDVALAWALNQFAGVPLIPAAATSLIAAAAMMYVVHEFWTFRDGARRVSAARITGTILSAVFAFGVRSACLFGTTTLLGLGERFAPLQLLLAAGLSFVVNFLIVRRIVGGGARAPAAPSQHPAEL